MKVLKIQRKNLLNMKMAVSYLNFVFHIEVKAKSKYRVLNFVFKFTKNMKWHIGYTDSGEFSTRELFGYRYLIVDGLLVLGSWIT